MSNEEFKDLNDLEKKVRKKTPGKKKASPPDVNKYETQELMPEEIAEVIKLEKEKRDNEVKKTSSLNNEEEKPAEKIQEGNGEDLKTLEQAGELLEEDTSIEQTTDIDENAQKEEGGTDQIPGPEFEIPKIVRPPSITLTQKLMIVVVILLIIMFYFMLKPRPEPTASKESAEKKGEIAAITKKSDIVTEEIQRPDTSLIKTVKKEKKNPVYELSDDMFRGTAPLNVSEKGPVLSEENDPEIAAIGDALKIRVGIIHGSKTITRRGIETKITSGTFQGFRITHTLQRKDGQMIKNDIAIVTPLRGRVLINGGILDSVRNTNYEKFHRELEASSLEVIKDTLQEEGIIVVQLRVTELKGRPVKPEFFIGNSNVGKVKLGMPIEMMKSVLPSSKYMFVERKILHDDDYYDTYKVYDHQRKSLFFVNEKDEKVWGIQIVSERFKTDKKLGIGNKLIEFRIHYCKIKKIEISSTAEGMPFVSIEGVNGKFFLEGKGIDFKNKVFPDNTKIGYILIGNSPFIE